MIGAKLTVLVEPAATVTSWCTVIGAPPPGGVTLALTVPLCALDEVLATSVFTVSVELLRSAAVFWTTWALPSTRGAPLCSWTGNWMPVLLSGGICDQSTSSTVSMVFGLFGCTSIASELVPARSSLPMSKAVRA